MIDSCSNCIVEQKWIIKSPDNAIKIIVTLNHEKKLYYSVLKKNDVMLAKSPLGIVTNIVDFSDEISFVNCEEAYIDEKYSLPAGKVSSYINNANELKLRFKKDVWEFVVMFRAYNDGIAYRYQIPGNTLIEVTGENSGFSLPEEELVNVWAQEFHRSYESTYEFKMLKDLNAKNYGMPLLFQIGKAGWMLLTEAAVYGTYCASNIKGISQSSNTLMLAFAPDQDKPVTGVCPFETPWRTAFIADDLNTIIRSTILENLNPPTKIKDTSWIKPGRASWPWFADRYNVQTLEEHIMYIDYTASMGWEYMTIDAGWEKNELPVVEAVKYADTKGVGIWLWAHSRNFREEETVRSKLSLWASWGIKGVKIDFFESDSQNMINAYDLIAEVAAENKLMVNYHGSTKPSGERRRWPHILTREGVMGAEYLGSDWSWCEMHPIGPTAEHNCTLPFTRNAVGHMDYTPVAFTKSQKRTSCAHQVATAVIFESHIQHLCDSRDVYSKSLAKEFLMAVPVTWDDTLLIEGYPGRYVTMARKKGNDWYIGAITSISGKNLELKLDFLDEGEYEATIYEDGKNFDDIKLLNLTEMYKRVFTVTKIDVLKTYLKKFGGCALMLIKKG